MTVDYRIDNSLSSRPTGEISQRRLSVKRTFTFSGPPTCVESEDDSMQVQNGSCIQNEILLVETTRFEPVTTTPQLCAVRLTTPLILLIFHLNRTISFGISCCTKQES